MKNIECMLANLYTVIIFALMWSNETSALITQGQALDCIRFSPSSFCLVALNNDLATAFAYNSCDIDYFDASVSNFIFDVLLRVLFSILLMNISMRGRSPQNFLRCLVSTTILHLLRKLFTVIYSPTRPSSRV